MSDPRPLDADRLLALARAQGVPLAPERTAALLAPVASLLSRLAALADRLPPEAAPPPETPARTPGAY